MRKIFVGRVHVFSPCGHLACPGCVDYDHDARCPRCPTAVSEMHTFDLATPMPQTRNHATLEQRDQGEKAAAGVTPGGPEEECREEKPVFF